MGRYTDPVCKLCRREGQKLFLKGERCYTAKCSVERRPYAAGEHGRTQQFRRRTESEYLLQMREKQRARRFYGVLERQFRRYFSEATRLTGRTGENLLVLLERRLDNVLYRSGLGRSRAEARQLVRHGHFEVNGRKVDIPSFMVKPGDFVKARQGSASKPMMDLIRQGASMTQVPSWLDVDIDALTVRVAAQPTRTDIQVPLNEQLIVEFYSR
ncbi:MAG: 30S ribosomal protein S4 [Anaerolineae bacterium]